MENFQVHRTGIRGGCYPKTWAESHYVNSRKAWSRALVTRFGLALKRSERFYYGASGCDLAIGVDYMICYLGA